MALPPTAGRGSARWAPRMHFTPALAGFLNFIKKTLADGETKGWILCFKFVVVKFAP
jgi:hypothetical protein